VVALSVLAVILMPQYGLTQALATGTDIDIVGTWKGVLPHKNSLGWICTAGVQVYAWRFLTERDRRLRHAACVAFFMFVAAETRSSTALITIILSIVLIAVLNTRSRRGIGQAALEWCVVGGTVLLLSIVLLNPGDVMALLGKSADMTGRIPLWRDILVSIEKRPLLGYGYGTFWVDQNDERARIWALNPWQPPDAHNAYLEMTLQLGILGAGTATVLLLVATKRAIDWCKEAEAQWAIYVATFLVVYVVTNVDETQLFRGGDFHCFVLSFCYFTLIRAKQRRAAADPAPPRRPALDRPSTEQPFRL
jgi:O-antigen ligase